MMAALKPRTLGWGMGIFAAYLLAFHLPAAVAGESHPSFNKDSSWRRLSSHIPPELRAKAQDLGRSAANSRLSLSVTLTLPDSGALEEKIRRLHDPRDPEYGHYLTPAQFAATYSPAQSDLDSVVQHLASHGLDIVNIHPNRLVIEVEGAASDIEQAFGVELHQYRAADGRVVHAPTDDPYLPAELGAKVAGISGLNGFSLRTKHLHHSSSFVPQSATAHTSPANPCSGGAVNSGTKTSPVCGCSTGSINTGTTNNPMCICPTGDIEFQDNEVPAAIYCTLGPASIASAYGFSSTMGKGTGQTLALVELDSFKASDITAYKSLIGVSTGPTVQPVSVSGFNINGTPGNGQGEVTLDIELMIAVAPAASTILVYEGANTDAALTAIYNKIATDDKAMSISTSWGQDEQDTGLAYAQSEEPIFQEFAAQGQSFYAAAGDCGAYDMEDSTGACVTSNGLHVDDPGSDPYVVSVGGTTLMLNSSGTRQSETTWGTPNTPSGGGGGGGISAFWSIPSWQSGVGGSGNQGSTTMRMVPDVALSANPDYGYGIIVGGAPNIFGGTSCAAPIWAAFTALVNQQRVSTGLSTLGFPNLSLYPLGKGAGFTTQFYDITSGSNNIEGGANASFTAVTGYDLASGWGSMNAGLFAALAIPVPTEPTAFALTPHNRIVNLSWAKDPGASTYSLARGTVSSGPFTTLAASLPSTTLSYVDTGLTNGTTYYYELTAVSASGQSPVSTASTTPVAAAPEAPTHFAIVSIIP